MIHYVPIRSTQLDDVVEQEIKATACPWTRQNLQDALGSKSTECSIIMLASDPIGYCVVQRVMDEAELQNFVIFRPHQSRGFGVQAMRALIQLLADAGTKVLFLEVRATNTIAQALYRKVGFTLSGRRKNYYRAYDVTQPREDALLMRLAL